MKKIKYLLLIFPLLFITNVKAVECNNLVDLTTSTNGSNFYVNSSDSASIQFGSSISFRQSTLNYSFIPNNSYIVHFEVDNSTFTYNYNDFFSLDYGSGLSGGTLLDNNSFTSKNFDYEFIPSSSTVTLKFTCSRNYYDGQYLLIKNLAIYTKENYQLCSSQTPPPTIYTYTFKVDDTVYETNTVEEGSIISLPENNPTKEGYTFVGWTLNGSEYTGGEIHSDLEIIAVFEEISIEPEEPVISTTVDLSGLIPYLLLISSLLMLIILKDFIKSLFKSRR